MTTTDFEALTKMLDAAAVGWRRSDGPSNTKLPLGSFSIEVGDVPRAGLEQPFEGGYFGFYTEIVFGPDGKLLAVWAYE